MTRLKVVDDASGLLAAPIMYSDNYFSLLPGETKQVTIELTARKTLRESACPWRSRAGTSCRPNWPESAWHLVSGERATCSVWVSGRASKMIGHV